MNFRLLRLGSHLRYFAGLALAGWLRAETPITSFDNFHSDALYAGWVNATVDEGPTAYSITAAGYGSNWKYLPVDGSGETTLRLTVTLSTTSPNDGRLGPIVTLVDGDGTSCNYAWYGNRNGHYVLTKPLNAPTWVNAEGTVPGLNLATLSHLHVAIDPSTFAGSYTVAWEDLRLTGGPALAITRQGYDPATREFSLTWVSRPGRLYTLLYAASAGEEFAPLQLDIPADGTATTAVVTLPEGEAGYLRVLQQ